ncbi:hypothetical protein [Paenibacillus protaetiae]|uniref:O-antigen ligase domain-containing protein n=1 Tax=Paenibacillus protaetiae TaxID=2509456 RepID=A0A4P6EUW8_9BACL|nr:hypothetical protein [Paenibacillus protaetiae]QAY66764.1 hypothetical protein ET464_10430 [Paenibacillus protaetiae]
MKNNKNVLTTDNLLLFSIALIPFSNQFVNMRGILTFFQYLPFIIIIFIFLLSKKKIYSNMNLKIIFFLFASAFTISPILGLTIFKYDPIGNLFYIILFLIFIAAIYILVSYVNMYNFKNVFNMILIGNSILLLYNLATHIFEIQVEDYLWILNRIRENRPSFGYSHPNTAGMYLFLEIILLSFGYKLNLKFKAVYPAIIIIMLVFLLATGSRTAVLSTLLFFILALYSRIISYVNIRLRVAILFSIISPIIFIYLLQFNYNDFFNSTSGRSSSIVQNIDILSQNNGLIFGIAPINVSKLRYVIDGLTFSDNWYVTNVIQFGLIGIIIFICNIFIIFVFLMKQKITGSMILLWVLLFYSGAENVMFIPGVLISWVVWTLILTSIKIRMEKEVLV